MVDEESGKELYAVRADEPAPIASVTKLMTARILRSRGLLWDEVVEIVGVEDGGGVAYFFPGDRVTVRELFRAMLVGSSNTATQALVRSSGLTLPEFIAEMNASAAGLGLSRTHFVDPTGLDQGNVSTAKDVALLARAALNDPEIAAAVITPSFTVKKQQGKELRVVSTNRLLSSFINKPPYTIRGGKTGFITESGYNVVLSVSRDGATPVTVVVLGSGTNDLRFQEAKGLAYWVFQNFRWPQWPPYSDDHAC